MLPNCSISRSAPFGPMPGTSASPVSSSSCGVTPWAAAKSRSTVELAVRAEDDYGLAKVVLWMKRDEEKEVAVKTWDRLAQKQETVIHKITLDAGAFRVGEKVAFRADVVDNCQVIRAGAAGDAFLCSMT